MNNRETIHDFRPVPLEMTCGTCRHWIKHPTTAMTLGQPERGDCREGPPSMVALGAAPGRNQVQIQALYPVVAPDFPACSRWQTTEGTNGDHS